MHYYSHHIGDFIRDTSRLSDAQCMAYLRLMWMYYDTERPIPNTPSKLAFQIGAKVEDVQAILEHFFVLDKSVDNWVHTRCERELADYKTKSEKASNSAKARWKNAKAMRSHSDRNADERETDANQEPRTKNQDSSLRSEEKDMSAPKAPTVPASAAAPAEVVQVFAHWQQVMSSPRSLLDDKRRKLIRNALKTGYTPEQLQRAIDGCAKSDWHMGNNDRRAKYNGLDLILRNAEQIDKFAAMADATVQAAKSRSEFDLSSYGSDDVRRI